MDEFEIRNMSGLSDEMVATVRDNPDVAHIIRSIAAWQDTMREATQSGGTIFDRGAYTPPNNPYDEMRAARTATETDDIVAGVAEITEAYAFQGSKIESTEADEADVFNQWAAEVDTDSLMRKMWLEEYSCSQFVCGMRWDWRTYTVRGKAVDSTDPNTEGIDDAPDAPAPLKRRARRKKYKLWVPVEFTILDSLKVVPVDHSPFGPDKLAWSATPGQIGWWRQIMNGEVVDVVAQEFYKGIYEPDMEERGRLSKMGVNPDRLILLNEENVWRHTLTKGDYDPFAKVRLKSLFPLLDMKRQLIMADRAVLIGAANYIILIRKGDKDFPGTPEEISALKENYNFIAKVPVIISDHRLTVDIIAPKQDLTLDEGRYTTIDNRILMRLLGTLTLKTERSETNITLSNSVARMMENRRHMIKRAIEKNVFRAIMNHPNNQSADGKALLKQEPNLVFTPRSIQLGFDPNLLSAMLALRTQREISRETMLEVLSLDEATEAMRLEYEEWAFDPIFQTQIPFAAQGVGNPGGPNGVNTPAANGRNGGRPSGPTAGVKSGDQD